MKEFRLEYPEDVGPVEIELRVQAGDTVRAGDVIAEVSVNIATQEFEAHEAMRIHAITRTARGYLFTVEDIDQRR